VKGTLEAKSRLGPDYPAEFRCGLAQAMLETCSCPVRREELAGVVVVTVDPSRARPPSASAPASKTAPATVTPAPSWRPGGASAEGRAGMLTVPGDIPLITADEVARLFAAHGDAPAFSIVPAHDRRGSNAILMTPPAAVPLAFGNDSFLPHLDAARRLGIEPAIVPLPGIGLDIDNGPDLALLMQRPSPTCTWAFLAARGLVAPCGSRSVAK
jgi:2-phospho-L-lactate guanylyltransferase